MEACTHTSTARPAVIPTVAHRTTARVWCVHSDPSPAFVRAGVQKFDYTAPGTREDAKELVTERRRSQAGGSGSPLGGNSLRGPSPGAAHNPLRDTDGRRGSGDSSVLCTTQADSAASTSNNGYVSPLLTHQHLITPLSLGAHHLPQFANPPQLQCACTLCHTAPHPLPESQQACTPSHASISSTRHPLDGWFGG